MRRTLLAMGAAVALAVAALPTAATAQHHGGVHFGGGHFSGGPHFGFRGPGVTFGFGVGPGYYDYGSDYASCSQVQRVWTPRGWRMHRVWVC
jgi:hypothetical protein